MADTVRTIEELLALFADNENGDISEQDARDFIVTMEAMVGERLLASLVSEFSLTLFDDTDAAAWRTTLGAAASSHTHAQSDITGLVSDLATKVPATRTINGYDLSTNRSLTASDVGAAATSHTHAQSDITGLVSDLASKASLAFSTIAISGQSNVVADSATDTLTLVASTGITLTTDASTDTITVSAPLLSATAGTATASRALILGSSKEVDGLGNVAATSFKANASTAGSNAMDFTSAYTRLLNYAGTVLVSCPTTSAPVICPTGIGGGPNYFTCDWAFVRLAAGVIELNSGTTGQWRDLLLRALGGGNASGSNASGGNLTLKPGQSTGNATPATVVLQGTTVGSSGATAQTLSDVLTVTNSKTITLTDDVDVVLGTTGGTQIGTASTQKLAFLGATPVAQQVLATGAGATVDNVISILQTLGLCKQS